MTENGYCLPFAVHYSQSCQNLIKYIHTIIYFSKVIRISVNDYDAPKHSLTCLNLKNSFTDFFEIDSQKILFNVNRLQ